MAVGSSVRIYRSCLESICHVEQYAATPGVREHPEDRLTLTRTGEADSGEDGPALFLLRLRVVITPVEPQEGEEMAHAGVIACFRQSPGTAKPE